MFAGFTKTFLQVLSPLDVVPDWIPLAGLMDDLGVATFVLNYVFGQLDADKPIEGMDGEPPSAVGINTS